MSATEEALNSALEGLMWGPELCEEYYHAALRLRSCSLHVAVQSYYFMVAGEVRMWRKSD
jgi:hypothetical protein